MNWLTVLNLPGCFAGHAQNDEPIHLEENKNSRNIFFPFNLYALSQMYPFMVLTKITITVRNRIPDCKLDFIAPNEPSCYLV